jgi:hypothetical protein
MAMWGNHIQRVKSVKNYNIIEKVADFKCLRIQNRIKIRIQM